MLSTAQTDGKVLAVWREPFKLGSPNVEAWTPGLTVADIVERMHCLPADFARHGSVRINDIEVPREHWRLARPRATSIRKPVAVTFHMAVEGGRGGGGGAKQIIALVAALALTLVTAGIGASWAVPLLGANFAAGTIGATLLAAGVSLVGALIVGALTSTPSASANASDTTSSNGGSSVEAAAISGNVLAQNAAIPRVIGTRRVFPAFLFEPVTEVIGQDEYVDAVYGLAGPHALSDVRQGNAVIETTANDADIAIQTYDGLPNSTKIEYPSRYGRTFPLNVEMSVHGTDPNNLAVFASPLPVFHATSTADTPDETWLHLLVSGLIRQADTTQSLRIPFRIRMKLRGATVWRDLPEVHYIDKTQSQRRIQFKFRFGETSGGVLPTPPVSRGFIEARKSVPAQTVDPVGIVWDADSYFSLGAGNDAYTNATVATTNVTNMSLEADTCTFYLSAAAWPSGIYDIEIKRGSVILDVNYVSATYIYNGDVIDFYNIPSSQLLPLSRDGVLDRITLVRAVSVKRDAPINQGNLALIYVRVRNRSVSNLSVLASGYVQDFSPPGVTWRLRATPADNSWAGVAWSPSLALFVAVAASGTGNRVMTSPDGINWTIRTSAADNNWTGVAWSPSLALFAAVSASGTVMTSPNGTAWTIRTAATANNWQDVCWAPALGLYVAVAASGTGNRVMTSPDGINWTSRTSAANNQWLAVVWSPELALLVAVANTGTGNRVMTSPDGINWTLRTSAADNQWIDIAWSPELMLFVAVALSGTGNRVMTSPDGINWTIRSTPVDNSWLSVDWSSSYGIFVAVSSDGSNNAAMTSSNGIDWTIQVASTDKAWRTVRWSPDLNIFAAVAQSGTAGSRVITSGDEGWTNLITTSNPAPHYRDILSGTLNLDPLPDELQDAQSLIDWRSACERLEYTCDLVTEGATLDELLRIVASCGFGRPYQSELWGIIRDYDRSAETPITTFSPRNTNSFKWNKAFPRLPAGLRVNFKDENYDYSGKQIVVYRNGADESDGRTEQITYVGITDINKIVTRAQFDLNQAELRPVTYSLVAAIESIVCRRGSLVALNHDVLDYHTSSARIDTVQVDGSNNVVGLVLDAIVDIQNGVDMLSVADMLAVTDVLALGLKMGAAIRRTNGLVTVHALSNVAGDTDTITFSTPISNPAGPASIYDVGSIKQIATGCLVAVGILGKEYRRLIVSDMAPGKDLTATLTLVDEAPQLWS